MKRHASHALVSGIFNSHPRVEERRHDDNGHVGNGQAQITACTIYVQYKLQLQGVIIIIIVFKGEFLS